MRLITAALCALATSAHAHPGHGAAREIHWHATDTSGFLMVAVLAALAIWIARGE